MPNVIIADSNQLIRIGLRVALQSLKDANIVGEAANGTQLREMLAIFGTDIVTIDFASYGFDIDLIPELKRIYPSLRFVAITSETSAIGIAGALKAGVSSYIKKDCDLNEVITSVAETSRGNRFFCGQILDTLRKESINPEDLSIAELSCEPVYISEREQEIITLIAEGYTNNQIADKLFLSNHTVNTHRKNIMAKLGVNNTAAVVMYAVKSQLVSPNKFLFTSGSGT